MLLKVSQRKAIGYESIIKIYFIDHWRSPFFERLFIMSYWHFQNLWEIWFLPEAWTSHARRELSQGTVNAPWQRAVFIHASKIQPYFKQTWIYTLIQTQTRAQIQTDIHKIYTQIHKNLHTQIHTPIYMHIHMQIHIKIHTLIYTRTHTQMNTHLHKNIHTQAHIAL